MIYNIEFPVNRPTSIFLLCSQCPIILMLKYIKKCFDLVMYNDNKPKFFIIIETIWEITHFQGITQKAYNEKDLSCYDLPIHWSEVYIKQSIIRKKLFSIA